MQKLKKDDVIGYKISDSDEGWGYYITIGNGKEYRHYEFSGTYNTIEDVTKYLETHDYDRIVKDFKEWCVYLECIEQV